MQVHPNSPTGSTLVQPGKSAAKAGLLDTPALSDQLLPVERFLLRKLAHKRQGGRQYQLMEWIIEQLLRNEQLPNQPQTRCLEETAFAQGQSQGPVRKIIDAHFHAYSVDELGLPAPANPVTGKVPRASTNQEVLTGMLQVMKSNRVVKVVASGSLERVKDYRTFAADRVISGIATSAGPLPDTVRFIELLKSGVIEVLGEMGLVYQGKTLNDPSLAPYLTICQRMAIPVAVHTGIGPPRTPYTCCPAFRTHLGNPRLLEEVLIAYPRLKVQLMHMGYPYLEEAKAIMHVYPQVYADIAGINWVLPREEFYAYLKAMLVAGYGKRIMYGSDQLIWEDAIPLSIQRVEQAPFLSEQQKQDIFYFNAARFFNLTSAFGSTTPKK